ncbi:MAG: hypothetical protein ACI9BF_000083 [Candidatus Paceibacteria bacterium]|jgi:hypothetical protein
MSKWIRRNIWLMPFAGIAIVILLKGLEIPYTSVDTITNSYLRLITEYTEEEYGTGSTVWLWAVIPVIVLVLWKLFISKSSSSGGGFAAGMVKIFDSILGTIVALVIGAGGLAILSVVLLIILAILDYNTDVMDKLLVFWQSIF